MKSKKLDNIVIVNGKPMWLKDFKELKNNYNDVNYIAFFTLASHLFYDITVTIVKVNKKPQNNKWFTCNNGAFFDEYSLLGIEYFSEEDGYKRSSIDTCNEYPVRIDGARNFWDCKKYANNCVVYDPAHKGIIDIEKTIEKINIVFNCDLEIIETLECGDWQLKHCPQSRIRELETYDNWSNVTEIGYEVRQYMFKLKDEEIKLINKNFKKPKEYRLVEIE